jgi:hypothetical protein
MSNVNPMETAIFLSPEVWKKGGYNRSLKGKQERVQGTGGGDAYKKASTKSIKYAYKYYQTKYHE